MSLARLIEDHRHLFAPIFEPALCAQNVLPMDLSAANSAWSGLDEQQLDAAILQKIADAGAIAAVGGYLEKRSMYADTELFQGDRDRCIHIGVDVFMPAGVALHAPLDAEVQSFANRQVSGDYGAVIILRHEIEGVAFHSLYGHLSEDSLESLSLGKTVSKGEAFARIGARPRNGNWPPHLHFQLVEDMQGNSGDYPGVVRPAELAFYQQNCPDPYPLLVA